MSNDVRDLVGTRPTGVRDTNLLAAHVSLRKPAPLTLADPVYIVMPGLSEDASIPMMWKPINGVYTVPAQGATAVVGYDENGVPYLLWWDAPATAPTVFARGKTTLTFTSSATSDVVDVAHGLTIAGSPVVPSAITFGASSGIARCFVQINSYDALSDGTTFSIQGYDTAGTTRTGTNDVAWMAST